ncbi:MAG: hypothetical protein WBB74_12255 [Gaiellaceae bacterium]
MSTRHRWAAPIRSARLVILAALIAALVAGAAFGLQAAGLRRATRNQLTAATVIGSLRRHELVNVRLTINHRRLSGVCVEEWFQVPGRRSERIQGAGFVLSNGERFVDLGTRIQSLGRPPASLTVALGELRLGCPGVLAELFTQRAVVWRGVRVTSVVADERPAYALRVRFRGRTIVYLADRKTLRPLGVRVLGRSVVGSSDVEVARLSRSEARSLGRALHNPGLGRRRA